MFERQYCVSPKCGYQPGSRLLDIKPGTLRSGERLDGEYYFSLKVVVST